MDAHLSFSFWAHASSTLRLIYFLSTVLSQERERGSYKSHVFSSSIKSRANPAITCAWCITSCQSYSGEFFTFDDDEAFSCAQNSLLKSTLLLWATNQPTFLFPFGWKWPLYEKRLIISRRVHLFLPFSIFLSFFCYSWTKNSNFLHLFSSHKTPAFGCVLLFQATFRCNPILKMHFAVFPSCSIVCGEWKCGLQMFAGFGSRSFLEKNSVQFEVGSFSFVFLPTRVWSAIVVDMRVPPSWVVNEPLLPPRSKNTEVLSVYTTSSGFLLPAEYI